LFGFGFSNGNGKGKTKSTHIWEITARGFCFSFFAVQEALEKRTAREERTKTNEQAT